MSWWIAVGMRGAMTKMAVGAALIALTALTALPPMGVAVPAHATPSVGGLGAPVPLDDLPTGPLDPTCATMPGYAACAGGPYWQAPPAPPGPPTGPLDAQCATMPADAGCMGSPFLPQPPPPPQEMAGPPMPPPV